MHPNRSLAVFSAALLLVVYSGCGSGDTPDSTATSPVRITQTKAVDKAGGEAASANNWANSVSLVTPDDFAAVVIRPRRIAQSPLAAVLLKNETAATEIKRVGIDPSEVEQLVVLFRVDKQAGHPDPVPVLVARFTHDVDGKEVLARMRAASQGTQKQQPIEEVQFGGKTCLDLGTDAGLAYCPSKNTIVLTSKENMKQVVSGAAPSGPLWERLKKANADNDIIVALEPGVYPDYNNAIDAARKEAPMDIGSLKSVQGGTATFNLNSPAMLHAVLDTSDADAAGRVQDLLQQSLGAASAGLLVAKQSIPKEAQSMFLPLVKLADQLSAGAKAAKSGSQAMLDVKRPEILDTAGPSVIGGAIVGAIEQYVMENRRTQQMGKLRAIGLAMLNYQSVQRSFPPAAIGKDGKPLLSWRVAILPYLGGMDLYRLFRLDEPWDSPHNLEVAKMMPFVFQSADSLDDGKTAIMVFTGRGAAFDAGRNLQLMEVRDGVANTILCVEAGPDKAVPWTKPEDLPFDPARPSAALGEVSAGGFLAAFFDGHVEQLKVDDKTLKALITPDGGELIDRSEPHAGR